MNRIKSPFLSRKCAITTFLLRKFMITQPSIAFEDFQGSSIAPQVMPPWNEVSLGGSPTINVTLVTSMMTLMT